MRLVVKFLLTIQLAGFVIASAMAQQSGPRCPQRPLPGSTVTEPVALASQDGELRADLTVRDAFDGSGQVHYCFFYQTGIEAPTLRVNPGDLLSLKLTNRISGLGNLHSHVMPLTNPCAGSTMSATSTNIHFHGLNVPPICHQDDVLRTVVNPTDPPFLYRVQIPQNETPGVYWYHPHPHGFVQRQVMGGASGAIIVEGIEKLKPEVVGLTQRVMIIRDQLIAGGGGDNDASNLTLNFVPATYPATAAPVISMQPSEKQFWRVLNASGETFLNLQVIINDQPEDLQIISLDAVPVKQDYVVKTIGIPPAGRAEFIMQGPPEGATATLTTLRVDTGPDGDPNPPHLVANIVATANAAKPKANLSTGPELIGPRRFADLSEQAPRTQRSLYFSEDLTDLNNPKFFLTVDGQTPKLFDPDDPPAIVTQQGAVEDWTLENRSGEIHAFHMHQIHFVLLERDGVPVPVSHLLDTVVLPSWDKVSPTYPSIKVRMDFRYPESVGTFVYHCHILDHEDGGMMAKIRVEPAK